MAKSFRQGVYHLQHPEKYIGNANNVVYRSSWELRMHRFLDNNTQILRWSSEEIKIPYVHPLDGRVHHYYPDYYVEYINRHNEVIKEIIEVKPLKQTSAPKKSRGKSNKTMLYEQQTWAVNESKWKYAMQWCEKRGLGFKIMTERSLFK